MLLVLAERLGALLGVRELPRRVALFELREERIRHVVGLLVRIGLARRAGCATTKARTRVTRHRRACALLLLGAPRLQLVGQRPLLHGVEVWLRTDYKRSTTTAEAPPPPCCQWKHVRCTHSPRRTRPS
ncbi:hypothetical protein GLX27_003607 [Malassezia furfur]|uniref:Secreted protein n=1 Tax=Malassezia furfur TaxID=55194 RepID=A0ABY8EUX2_MALFU|nr:hypothetical protein GLX27_003607 [Malassezia furfur]